MQTILYLPDNVVPYYWVLVFHVVYCVQILDHMIGLLLLGLSLDRLFFLVCISNYILNTQVNIYEISSGKLATALKVTKPSSKGDLSGLRKRREVILLLGYLKVTTNCSYFLIQ